MPLVEVTYAPSVPETMLRELASVLPHLVSEAVQCPEEPYDGALRPGDVDIRFREFGPFDRGGLPVVIEVRSKWFESRAVNRQERVDVLHEEITDATGLGISVSTSRSRWRRGRRPTRGRTPCCDCG